MYTYLKIHSNVISAKNMSEATIDIQAVLKEGKWRGKIGINYPIPSTILQGILGVFNRDQI